MSTRRVPRSPTDLVEECPQRFQRLKRLFWPFTKRDHATETKRISSKDVDEKPLAVTHMVYPRVVKRCHGKKQYRTQKMKARNDKDVDTYKAKGRGSENSKPGADLVEIESCMKSDSDHDLSSEIEDIIADIERDLESIELSQKRARQLRDDFTRNVQRILDDKHDTKEENQPRPGHPLVQKEQRLRRNHSTDPASNIGLEIEDLISELFIESDLSK